MVRPGRTLWIVLLVLPCASAMGWLLNGVGRSGVFGPEFEPRKFATALLFTFAFSLPPACLALGLVAAGLHFSDAVLPGARAARGLCWKCGFQRDARARCGECGEPREIPSRPLWRWAVPLVALVWALGFLAGASISEVELLLQDRWFLREAAAFHRSSTAWYRCTRPWPWSGYGLAKSADGGVVVMD
jgi:hypothetical protein